MTNLRIDGLLAVIKMPEGEQKLWLAAERVIKTGPDAPGAAHLLESLEEAAFRLRNETITKLKHTDIDWITAVCIVIKYCEGTVCCKECKQDINTKKLFDWSADAQPIHWIIAALIALELLRAEMRQH